MAYDDSAVLVDNRSDGEDEIDGNDVAARTALLNSRSAKQSLSSCYASAVLTISA